MVREEALLGLLPEVIALQEISVSLHWQLLEDLPDQGPLLGAEQLVHGIRPLVLEPGETERAVTDDAPCALVVPGGQVPRERGDERGQLRWVADLARAHPLEQDPQSFLVEVLGDGALAGDGLQDGPDAAAEALDEIPLGSGLACADALHEGFQDIVQSDAILPFPTWSGPAGEENRPILDVGD